MKNKTLKYPKLTRKENRACKLSNEEIKEIRELHSEGVSLTKLSKMFKISLSTIYYWTNETYRLRNLEKAKERIKIDHLINHLKYREQSRKYVRRWKKERPQFRNYLRHYKYIWKKKNRKLSYEIDKRYYSNHKIDILKKKKRYYTQNKKQIKKTNQKYYAKNRFRILKQKREAYQKIREKPNETLL